MSAHSVHQKYAEMFRPAVRTGVSLIIGFAGASGSGKTMSAFRMAQGIVGRDKPFAVIDTEARRALHYAPIPGEEPDFVKTFRFHHAELVAPFRPEAYEHAIRAAAMAGYGAVVVDSFSHVWEGEGGVLDWSDEILQTSVDRAMKREREQRSEWQLREAFKRSSWIEPKRAHKMMVQALLQLRAHIILCLRAEDKIDFVKDGDKTKVVPMETLAGFKGWIPICDKRLPFELTASFVLTPDKPGMPQPIKLQEQHRYIFEAGKHVDEDSGKRLAAWARGGSVGGSGAVRPVVSGVAPSVPAESGQPTITQAQLNKFWTIASGAKWSDDEVMDLLTSKTIDSAGVIPADQYEAILDRLRKGPRAAA